MQLIDPKMSIDTIRSYIEVWDCKGCLPYGGVQHNVMSVDDLLCLPTIEAEPVKHGRWIEETEPDENGNVISMCNQCYHTDEHCKNIKIPYCWYCGARMDGGERR